jgi:1,4-dihydroxy-2-naphthoate polyprenyltransferase
VSPRRRGEAGAEHHGPVTLVRPIGLGLASRGDVRDTVGYAEQARAAGCESVWFHESYFERDAVSYATAVAAAVPEIRVALGALSTYARPVALTAMTVSALDDLAPGRITVALGSALPLRLAQMGIRYDPDEAIAAAETQLGQLRALWRGERLPPGLPGVPALEPMFPPVHRVPLWVAGYRRAFHELAGRAADGYLARPAESVPAVALATRRIAAAAAAAGRSPAAVAVGGYLLALVDSSRRAALDRAKREPFVIYMLSVQSDTAMRRVGLEPELRHRIAAAWRAEDYHGAAGMVPDELVDAFLLCGTAAEVADRVEAYVDAGMTLPILQPVLQTDAQVAAVLEAAVRYGSARSGAGGGVAAEPASVPGRPAAAADPVGAGAGAGVGVGAGPGRAAGVGAAARAADRVPLGRRLRALVEITRPFSLTASIVPVAAGGALALVDGRMSWPLFALALLAGTLLQVGTNVVNEVYDVRKGVDSITSPRASQALVTGRVTERDAFLLAGTAFALCAALGLVMVAVRGWPLAVIGAVGIVGGWGYTAPPLQYKYRALGLPLVFLLMGPLMVLGGYYTITGGWSLDAAVASVPIGLLVTAILHGNEWRDIGEDARAGIRTISISAGRGVAHWLYVVLLVGAYVTLALGVAFDLLPRLSLLAVLSMPLLVQALRASELGATGQQREIAMIDRNTARLHATFGALFVLGLAAAA